MGKANAWMEFAFVFSDTMETIVHLRVAQMIAMGRASVWMANVNASLGTPGCSARCVD